MFVFGDVLLNNNGDEVPMSVLKRIIERPIVKPRYRLSVLTPDEQVEYLIPESDIVLNGISYTEQYQNGQRRNLTINLANSDGRYTPALNGLWVNTKMSFEIGLEYNGTELWFPKGVYIMGNTSLTRNNSDRQVSIQLSDKYAIFEGKTGTLETAYEVELGSDICDAIRGVMNFAMGNGYIMDYKEPIFDPSFIGQVTQQTVRVEQGGTLSEIIDSLATQLSAEYYYNTVGNLCFYPINYTVDDSVKPVIWTYKQLGRDLHNMNLNYANEDIVNQVKVVGDNVDSGLYVAVVQNNNPASPICVQNIGVRMNAPYSESNVWSDDLAKDLANYYLRQASFVGVQFSCNVSFNPVLTVNNLIEVEDEFLDLKRESLLINSISFSSDSGQMSISCCNTSDLPSMISTGRG